MPLARRAGARIALALALLASVLAILVAIPGAAQATNCSGQTWPSNGSLQTSNWPGSNEYVVTFQFSLTADELCSLQQTGPYLEIDFRLRNFDVPAGWEGYTVSGTNLPGALHDTAVSDPQYITNPATTRIYTSQLHTGTTYYTTLTWTANAQSGLTPYIFFVWEPSHWAVSTDPIQAGACLAGGNFWPEGDSRNPNEAWCIDPVVGADVTLFGTHAFAGGYANGDMPLDGFRWYDWSPSTSSDGTSSSPQPTPAPSGNPFGFLDAAGLSTDQTRISVRGWAIDPDTTSAITVNTYVDGNLVGSTTANTSRPDVGTAYPGFGDNHGYYAEYSVGVGVHQVCTSALNTGAGDTNPQLPSCKTVQRPLTDTHASALQSPSGPGQVFVRGANGDLQTYWQPQAGSSWTGPMSLGGSITDSPSALMTPSGVVAAFARGTGGNLVTFWQTAPGSGTWNSASLGGNFLGSPSAIQSSTGAGQVFVRGTSGDLQTFWQPAAGSGWNGPLSLGGSITDSPVAIMTPSGVVAAFARGSGGDLQTWWQAAPGSGTWNHASLGGNFQGSPVVIQTTAGAGQVFVRGSNNDLQTYWQASPGSSWSGPQSLGGQISGSIAAAFAPGNVGQVFAGGTSGHLLTWWQSTAGSSWSGPLDLGGSQTASPAMFFSASGPGQVFTRGASGDLQTFWQSSTGSNWTGPLSLGGSLGQ